MATDPLILLRRSVSAGLLPLLSTTADASFDSVAGASIAEASHLIFRLPDTSGVEQRTCLLITQKTRFVSSAGGNRALDLRSVLFCWLNKDKSIGEYITATQELNKVLLSQSEDEGIVNLVFAEKLDLIAWLSGEVGLEESEYIQSANIGALDTTADVNHHSMSIQDTTMQDASLISAMDKRATGEKLQLVHSRERKMGGRSSVLRGVRAQDFADIRRRYSALFFTKAKLTPTMPLPPSSSFAAKQTLASHVPSRSNHGRRPEPIILISPSASSLLRLPNIKSFLEDGRYTEPESGSSANILHLMRMLPAISAKSLRFVIVDDPSSFRPDYWDRLVAVFTTGQTWQFKNYKWSQPTDLFAHALGVYVGFKGEMIPDAVKSWGRGVLSVQIDQGTNRWRDREVVEDIWRGIEDHMKIAGWGKGVR